MSDVHIQLSVNDQQLAVLMVSTPGVQFQLLPDGRVTEIKLHTGHFTVEPFMQALDQAGIQVSKLENNEQTAATLFLKYPEDLHTREWLWQEIWHPLRRLGQLPVLTVNTTEIMFQLLDEQTEVFVGITDKAALENTIKALKTAFPHAIVEVKAVVGGEPVEHSHEAVKASAQEVGSGLITELAPAVAEAVMGQQKGASR